MTQDSSSRVSPILGGSIAILRVLKEAAGIAPVPFLKGAISTALTLAEAAHVRFAVPVTND
jgi:hypothetical protein